MARKNPPPVGRGKKQKKLNGDRPTALKCFLAGVWHRFRLLLPRPANVMRSFAANYTFLYRLSGAAIAGVPPVILNSYYQVSTFAAELRSDWPAIATLLDKHVLIGCIVGGLWVFFVMWLRRYLASFADTAPPGWETAPSAILKTIDNVVGAKQQRFSDYLAHMGTSPTAPTAGKIFSSITQPTQQIAELVKGVYSTFDILLPSTLPTKRYTLKTNLAVIRNDGTIASIKYHCPSNLPVRSTNEALNRPNSTIRCAVRTKRPIVIESILAESSKANPRFAVTDDAYSQEDGSLICYPVILEGIDSVVFVLSVFVDVPGAFKPKYLGAFNQAIEPFALRLKLEYALLAMKEGSPS